MNNPPAWWFCHMKLRHIHCSVQKWRKAPRVIFTLWGAAWSKDGTGIMTVVHVQETGPRPLTFLKLWRRSNAGNRHEFNEKLKSNWLRKRRNDTRTPAKPIILIVLLKFIDCDYEFHSTDQSKLRPEMPCSSAVTESQHDSEINRVPYLSVWPHHLRCRGCLR